MIWGPGLDESQKLGFWAKEEVQGLAVASRLEPGLALGGGPGSTFITEKVVKFQVLFV